MRTRWSNLSRQGRSLNRVYGWLDTRIKNMGAEKALDDDLILRYISQLNNTARTMKSISESVSLQNEVEELKSIVYNLPDEVLEKVRAKLGK